MFRVTEEADGGEWQIHVNKLLPSCLASIDHEHVAGYVGRSVRGEKYRGSFQIVIAAEASVGLDVRIKQAKQASGIDRKLRSLKPFDKHCKLTITGGINRLPMERTAGVAALYKKAHEIARQLGWKLEEAAVGGGSDGNFTAGMGIPTLDGMGGVGEGAHAVHEFIVISELPRRALLLAGMIESV